MDNLLAHKLASIKPTRLNLCMSIICLSPIPDFNPIELYAMVATKNLLRSFAKQLPSPKQPRPA
jgi:hypothetical protein